MNRYSATIISIGLSLILINNYSLDNAIARSAPAKLIAKQAPDNPVNNCNQISNQVNTPSNTIPVDQIVAYRNLVASTKTTPNATQYSFWWAALQFDPFDGKLVQNWFAYPQKQQINLVVNWQLWTLLDYFGRYRFVNQFGTVARKYGYSLNIFNQKDQCLASYKYNSTSIPPKWELNLVQSGRSSLPIEPEPQQPSILEVP
ncbi:MAG: hypothetical protein KME09_22590 [Pleurocapsa minor HA4230-MV1]|jgi:hypothetical protein|nr:hypothetical protein [Pleurocapsa minor HA4230-MV1]